MRLRGARRLCRLLTIVALTAFVSALLLLRSEVQTLHRRVPDGLPSRHDFEKCQLNVAPSACLLNSTKHHTVANKDGNCSLKVLTKSCPAFLRAHRYYQVPVSEEEKRFPLAFSIRMHRSPAQAERLLRTIYRPHNFYCIHVDAKAEAEVYAIMAAGGACVHNVDVLVDRVKIRYGAKSDTLVRADLKCMQAALGSEVKWKYLITMCGEEFPLRTNLEMVRILKLFRGANDVEAYTHPDRLRHRLQGSMMRRGDVYEKGKLTLRSSPDQLQIAVKKGSAYASFTREFVQALFADKRSRTILQWFNDTYSPEENVWATLNALPGIPGGYGVDVLHDVNQQASRAVVWLSDKYRCKGDYVRGVCVFGAGDLPWLLNQSQLVANKFVEARDSRVLDCLEAKLFQRAESGDTAINYAYFESLPHVSWYRSRGNPIEW